MIGLPAPEYFSLNSHRLLDFWRPITSMAYLGPPSMSMANNLYFLVKYGQEIEKESGTATYAWFLMIQTVILSILGLILQFPFQAKSIISAAVYTSCQLNPMESM
jgi:hypothetical protein